MNTEHESIRRAVTAVLAWGGWLGCAAVFLYSTVQYDPSKGEFAPQWVGFTFILSMGVAIAAGVARGRQRLSDTIVYAFRAGMDASNVRADEIKERIAEHERNS